MAEIQKMEAGLLRIVAPNPSPMTGNGTNTYILGEDRGLVVIDPRPEDESHLAAILESVGGREVSRILVTHAHLDHSPLSRELSQRTGAPVLAYGNARAGRSERMSTLGDLGGGEGVDISFDPDEALVDGQILETSAGPIECLWTPGHFGSHMTFIWHGVAFSGDLVMGWASTFISPPDGDIADFLASCRCLKSRVPSRLYPGHGAPVEDPGARIDWLIGHRDAREAEILEALAQSPGTPMELAARIYTDISPRMHPAAARNVFAHLIDLAARGQVRTEGVISPEAIFYL